MIGKPIDFDSYDVYQSIDMSVFDQNFNHLDQSYPYNFSHLQDDCELLKTTGRMQIEELQSSENSKKNQRESSKIQHSAQMKKYNGVEFPISTLISVIDAKKGRRRETKNLSKIVKDHIFKFLKGLIKAKIFQQNQLDLIESFRQQSGSIPSFEKLFKNQRIADMCCRFLSSSEYVAKVLSSKKLQMSRKLQVIKYAQKIRELTLGKIGRWKTTFED